MLPLAIGYAVILVGFLLYAIHHVRRKNTNYSEGCAAFLCCRGETAQVAPEPTHSF
jgi:hypothetical protein